MAYLANRGGIPCIESTAVNLTTTAETFSFNPHPYRGQFLGLILVKISLSETAPGTAVPIEFVTTGVSNSNIAVLDPNGTPLTTATWPGEGIYLAFYDRVLNELSLLTGVL